MQFSSRQDPGIPQWNTHLVRPHICGPADLTNSSPQPPTPRPQLRTHLGHLKFPPANSHATPTAAHLFSTASFPPLLVSYLYSEPPTPFFSRHSPFLHITRTSQTRTRNPPPRDHNCGHTLDIPCFRHLPRPLLQTLS